MEAIEEDYVSFETAKLLKEKGFDEHCSTSYSTILSNHKVEESRVSEWGRANQIYRPTHQMAMAWLREKGIYVCPKLCCFCGSKKKDIPYYLWEPRIIRLPSNNIIYPQPLDMCKHYENYEEATEKAIKYSLENLV